LQIVQIIQTTQTTRLNMVDFHCQTVGKPASTTTAIVPDQYRLSGCFADCHDVASWLKVWGLEHPAP